MEVGRAEGERTAQREPADVCARLAATHPAVYEPKLAEALDQALRRATDDPFPSFVYRAP
ncbi:hypothetical protein ACFRCI_34805 [Streptomyces sp. NPDC056638]|uniref:hypothetical protein n=1 Tax=Streptomyces sp. NPDC056638 TaxID=3345887 RepID=UPI0036BC3AD1